jgi:hypothetical protein
MAYIFSRAKELIVWLGGLDPRYREPMIEERGTSELYDSGIIELCNKPYWK